MRRLSALLVLLALASSGCADAERLVRDTLGTPGGPAGPSGDTASAPPAPDTGEPAWEVRGSSFSRLSGAYSLTCPPNPSRTVVYSVYGTNPAYWGSSPLCQAGVHAGAITYARGGTVVFEMGPGRSRYAGSTRNGERSSDTGAWDYSFAVLNGDGAGAASSAAAGVEVGVDRPGSDYRSFDAGGAGYAVCQAACARSTECRAWTHTAPGVQSADGMCWLKTAVPDAVAREGMTSGVK